ncbi:transposase [Streptomyces qinglanensis]
MGKKPRRARRSFTPEFKAEIVELCRRGDRSVGQVAKDFDLVVETRVRDWVRQAEIDEGDRAGLTSSKREALTALRRENRRRRKAPTPGPSPSGSVRPMPGAHRHRPCSPPPRHKPTDQRHGKPSPRLSARSAMPPPQSSRPGHRTKPSSTASWGSSSPTPRTKPQSSPRSHPAPETAHPHGI